ncbi:MAG TPA: hypothetical protein VL172_06195 [Kofleriaceae bacterium]|jgi:hypothetical protein|nr:hypothetical protein [Kofleriaceae bacterium]
MCALVCLLLLLLGAGGASAQPNKNKPAPLPPLPPAGAPAPKGKMTKLDFTGLDLSGRQRTPQLLYFLERAGSELQAAFLERRSFIPEMMRSLDEERL